MYDNAIMLRMENFSRQSQEVTDTDATDAKPKSKEELAAEYDLPADASWSEIDAHTAAKHSIGGTALQ